MTTNALTTLDTAAVKLPYAFLEAISDHGEQALGVWLREHAPQNVAALFDNWLCVKIAAQCSRAGDNLGNDTSLLESVANVARGVSELGGTWHGPFGEIMPKTRQVDIETTEE